MSPAQSYNGNNVATTGLEEQHLSFAASALDERRWLEKEKKLQLMKEERSFLRERDNGPTVYDILTVSVCPPLSSSYIRPLTFFLTLVVVPDFP